MENVTTIPAIANTSQDQSLGICTGHHAFGRFEVKRLDSNARLPTKGSAEAAGWDMYANQEATILPRGMEIIATGISVAAPHGTYVRIAPRSGLAAKHGIDVGAGVCDSDYRGELKVILFNHSDNVFHVCVGDRIAQMIITPYVVYDSLCEVSKFSKQTARGEQGFGSTGHN